MRQPFSARSVIASALLGTVPPVLPGRLLVALAREFGIAEGTARVALSRMVERGELVNDGGHYALAGPLVERQQRQEAGLRPATRTWTGAWEMAVVRPGARTTEDRSALRIALGRLALREHREGIWLRPDNLDPGRLPAQRLIAAEQTDGFSARPDGDPAELAAALFELDEWAARGDRADGIDASDPAAARTGRPLGAGPRLRSGGRRAPALRRRPAPAERRAPGGLARCDAAGDPCPLRRRLPSDVEDFFREQRES